MNEKITKLKEDLKIIEQLEKNPNSLTNIAQYISVLEHELYNKPDTKFTLKTADGKEMYIVKCERVDMQKEFNESFKKLNEKIKEKENIINELKEIYKKTCDHLFEIGNDELAKYLQAQIDENNVFTVDNKF